MDIRITRLALTNFKCFKQKEFTFNPDGSVVTGRNGAGKTTIADAIFWCLFGKNAVGQTDFDLKTHKDGTNEPIPHLEHSVEMTLLIDGSREVFLKRTLKEVWIKKRCAEVEVFKNNTTECWVNGESYQPTEYKKYIASLISEDVFRAITSPTFFTSLPWKEQYKFLRGLVDMSDVSATKDELEGALSEIPVGENIETYLKGVLSKMSILKDKLSKIPVRLEEQNKALPEKLDWESLKAEKEKADADIKVLDQKIADLHNGNGAEVKRSELRSKISETTVAIDKIESEARNAVRDLENKKFKDVQEASAKFNDALNNQRLMESTIEADKRLIARLGETDYEAELQKLRDQWPSNKFNVDTSLRYCPTCGQEIPDVMFEEKVEELRKKFNLDREEKIKKLNAQADKVKKEQKDSAEEKVRLDKQLADHTAQLENIKQNINEIFSDKAKLEKQVVPTIEQYLEKPEYAQYHTLKNQLKELKESLDAVVDTEEDGQLLESLKKERSELIDSQSLLSTKVATEALYNRGLALIDGIKKEEKDLIKQLSELEKKEDIIRNYQNRCNTILEERINQHFLITRWKMSQKVNNGGDPFDEPWCECYDTNGTAYHNGLNKAAKLNIGLDICNTLCKFYNVSAPIIIDNAESNLLFLVTTGQQIRLQVLDTDLTIQ